MSAEQIREALSPVFAAFCDVSAVQWQAYVDVLADVNPGDLDEALQSVQRDHGYHNAPLPKFVADRVDEAKRRRISAVPSTPEPHIDPNEGELRAHTIPGIGTLKLRVLPDEHPALRRYVCFHCKDSGWVEIPRSEPVQMTVARCSCWKDNPVIQRERERRARYTKERGER